MLTTMSEEELKVPAIKKFQEREEKEWGELRMKQEVLSDLKYERSPCLDCWSVILSILFFTATGLLYSTVFLREWYLIQFDTELSTGGWTVSYSLIFDCEDSDCGYFDAGGNQTSFAIGCDRSGDEISPRVNGTRTLYAVNLIFNTLICMLCARWLMRSTRVHLALLIGVIGIVCVGLGVGAAFLFNQIFAEGWLWCGVGWCEAKKPQFSPTCESDLAYGFYVYLAGISTTMLGSMMAIFVAIWYRGKKKDAKHKSVASEDKLVDHQLERRKKWDRERRRELERRRKLREQPKDTKLSEYGREEDFEGFFDPQGNYHFNDPDKYKRRTISVKEEQSAERSVGAAPAQGTRFAEVFEEQEETQVYQRGRAEEAEIEGVMELAGVGDWVQKTDGSGFYYSSKLNADFDPTSHKYFDHGANKWKASMWYSGERQKSGVFSATGKRSVAKEEDEEELAHSSPTTEQVVI